jgi:hypothetical protein
MFHWKHFFFPCFPNMLGIFQGSPACPSKKSIKMKIRMEHWWSDTGRGKPKYLEEPVAGSLCPPHIPDGVAWD